MSLLLRNQLFRSFGDNLETSYQFSQSGPLVGRGASRLTRSLRCAGTAGGAEAHCPEGDATLRGAYMSMRGGSVVVVGPVAFMGTIYYDDKGGVINPFTQSINGAVSRGKHCALLSC